MNWDSLVGQQPAKTYLRSVLKAGRRAHAYLFQGPLGVGKRTAAYIFAQTLLCQESKSPDEPCGKCKSCHWFNSRAGHLIEHPDVIMLLTPDALSERNKKGEDSSGKQAEREMSREKVMKRIVGDHEQIIRLETIQYVCEQLHRSPMVGSRRVVIIPEAQRLCRGQAEPANAFLKTLEEPPESSLIIMTSSQPEALLETIVSRVQTVNFRRLSSDEVRAGLSKKSTRPQAETEMAALLADGSLGRALELLEGDLKNWRNAVLSGLEKFNPKAGPQLGLMLWALADHEGTRLFEQEKKGQKGDAEAEAEDSDEDDESKPDDGEVKTESGWKRYVFRRLLEVCEICFRDGLVCAAGGGKELLLQPDQQKLAQNLAAKFGADGCEKVLAAIREAMLAVRLYVRGDVVGRALAGKMVEAQAVHQQGS